MNNNLIFVNVGRSCSSIDSPGQFTCTRPYTKMGRYPPTYFSKYNAGDR